MPAVAFSATSTIYIIIDCDPPPSIFSSFANLAQATVGAGKLYKSKSPFTA